MRVLGNANTGISQAAIDGSPPAKARPIIIEDPDLALPFTRMLRARELRLRTVGGLVAEAMSYAISRYYGADIESRWYIGQYVLPGNVPRVILKPRHFGYVR
jgi:hypothetical protein